VDCPVPVVEEWIERPSTEAAESGAARQSPITSVQISRRITSPEVGESRLTLACRMHNRSRIEMR